MAKKQPTQQLEKQKSLIQLMADSGKIVQALIENGGEVTEEIQALMDLNSKEVSQKIDNYGGLMERLKFEQDYWKSMQSKCGALAKACKSTEDFLKDRLKSIMGVGESMEGEVFRFSKFLGKKSLKIDEEQLSSEWLMQVVDYVPDKERIEKALLEGQEIPGAKLVPCEVVKKSIRSRQ